MRTKTFTVTNGDCQAAVTVYPEVGWMWIDNQVAQNTLGVNDDDVSNREAFHRMQFARAYAQSTVEGNLGFVWPEMPNDKKAMQAACAAWLQLPGKVIEEWINATYAVNETPNDPDLKPPDKVDPKKDSAPTS